MQGNETLIVWDLRARAILGKVHFDDHIKGWQVSPDGQSLLVTTGYNGADTQLLELPTLKRVRSVGRGHGYWAVGGTRIVTNEAPDGGDRSASIQESRSGKVVASFGTRDEYLSEVPSGSRYGVTVGSDKLTVRDLTDGASAGTALTRTWRFPWGVRTAISPDTRFVLTSDEGSGLTIWSRNDWKALCTLRLYEDGGWTAIGPNDQYDGNAVGIAKHLTWQANGRTYPASLFARGHYRPGLIAEVVRPYLTAPRPKSLE
ncbi:MAG: hypothetical protein HY248_06920 [Fimbriimonas ginsengisoli]|nr:hypothetical protein [Fimbriimonas ginsengisoli]